MEKVGYQLLQVGSTSANLSKVNLTELVLRHFIQVESMLVSGRMISRTDMALRQSMVISM